jgi:hypothetical protein
MQVEVLHTENEPEIRRSARRYHAARDSITCKNSSGFQLEPSSENVYYVIHTGGLSKGARRFWGEMKIV